MPRLRFRLDFSVGQMAALAVALCLLLAGNARAAASSSVTSNEIRDGLPKYEPKATKEKSPPANVAPQSAGATRPRLTQNDLAPKPEPSKSLPAEPVVTLPRFMVTGRQYPAAPAPLPRLAVPPIKGRDDKSDHSFETPAARDARLIRKHFSPFERLLGGASVARARAAEALEQSAIELNDIADAIESPPTSPADAAAKKKLREDYYDVFLSRPK